MVTTAYFYDEHGRLAGSTATREPEFTDVDRALFVALAELEFETDENGLPIAETTDVKNQFAYRADPLPIINYATKARLDARDAYLETYPDATLNGASWDVRRR